MPQFNFQFGKKKPDKKQLIIVSIVVSTIIAALSQCTGVSENGLWDLLDEVQRKYFPQTILNELIRQDPDKIERRVTRDVDREIDRVTKEYDRIIDEENKKYRPRYVEEENDESVCYTDECKALAPPMRICAPWVDNCTQ
jgi:predicted polyphosphate/ATP-dependent NAD kinase